MKKSYLFLVMIMLLLLCVFTVTAANTGANADSSDGGSPTTNIMGGPSSIHTGWLCYIIDSQPQQISETKVYYSSSERPDKSTVSYNYTRFGKKINFSSKLECPWFSPFDAAGNTNGAKIKNMLLQNEYIKHYIAEEFGVEMLQRFGEEDIYLVLEPFFWGQVYNQRTATGTYLCASAYGWAKYQNSRGLGDYGSVLTRRYTNNTFPNCAKLEREQFGLIPESGLLSNQQIISSGNGFMLFWVEDEDKPNTVVGNEEKQLYAIRNWADGFDISQSIPSGEEVHNEYTADSFYGHCTISSEVKTKSYRCTYTYEYLEECALHPNGHKRSVSKDISFSAQLSYEYIKRLEIYNFHSIKVYNKAFPYEYIKYTRDNTELFYDVTVDSMIYDFSNQGATELYNVPVSEAEHFHFAPDISDKTVQVASRSDVLSQYQDDVAELKAYVNNNSWSRNDRLIVNMTNKDGSDSKSYIFMQDIPVKGCKIYNTSFNSMAATSDYRYGGAGIFLDSFLPVRNYGKQTFIIPEETDNNDYPTGIECRYSCAIYYE